MCTVHRQVNKVKNFQNKFVKKITPTKVSVHQQQPIPAWGCDTYNTILEQFQCEQKLKLKKLLREITKQIH